MCFIIFKYACVILYLLNDTNIQFLKKKKKKIDSGKAKRRDSQKPNLTGETKSLTTLF